MSKHINATEAIFLQKQTTEWLDFSNKLITDAAKAGCDNVVINIRTDAGIGNKYYEHSELYRKHLHDRGFKTEWSQSTLKITWCE